MKLPKAIAAYFDAANAHDVDAVAACFRDDAVVRDEGRERQGVAAIREWEAEVSKKFQPAVTVLDVAEGAGNTIVTGRVSGNFPGSPIDLRHVFSLDGDRIARLEIVA